MATIAHRQDPKASKKALAKPTDGKVATGQDTLQLHKKRESITEDPQLRRSGAAVINSEMNHVMMGVKKPLGVAGAANSKNKDVPIVVIQEPKNTASLY